MLPVRYGEDLIPPAFPWILFPCDLSLFTCCLFLSARVMWYVSLYDWVCVISLFCATFLIGFVFLLCSISFLLSFLKSSHSTLFLSFTCTVKIFRSSHITIKRKTASCSWFYLSTQYLHPDIAWTNGLD